MDEAAAGCVAAGSATGGGWLGGAPAFEPGVLEHSGKLQALAALLVSRRCCPASLRQQASETLC
jgi:hypothetical protein